MDLFFGWRTETIEKVFRAFSRLPDWAKRSLISGYATVAEFRLRRLRGPARLTYFVTSRCTRHCPFCFYASHLTENAGNELNLTEIERWVEKIPVRLQVLSLTGGEPFLRPDLTDIVDIFWRVNRIAKISINTNGDLPQEAEKACRQMLQATEVTLNLQVSVTRPEDLAAGSRVRETMERFRNLQKTHARVSQISALTTVTKDNLAFLPELKKQVAIWPDIFHKVQWIRGIPGHVFPTQCARLSDFTPPDFAAQALAPEEQDLVIALFSKNGKDKPRSLMVRKQLAMLEAARYVTHNRRPLFPCLAGLVDGVVFEDGRVSICENLVPFASLRDFEFNFAQLWHSPDAQKARQCAVGCACSHPCNLTTSMSFNKKALQKILS